MLLFCSKHDCKKSWKISTSRTLFRTRIWKNCDFAWFGRKIKINRDLVEMLQNFIDTYIKRHIDDVQSFVTFRISLDFFIFSIKILRVSVGKKKSRLIQNVTKLFTSSICIIIEVSVKFRRILNKFRFILVFWPKYVKSQSEAKPEAIKYCWG